jgi:hypothetical protein
MSKLYQDESRNQTAWECGLSERYANIPEGVHNEKVINDAKSIVDYVLPQRSGPHGTSYYSFRTREYVLNLILYFYQKHKRFPKGDVCFVKYWYLEKEHPAKFSWFFTDRKKARNYLPGTWIHLPTLREVKKSKEVQHGK